MEPSVLLTLIWVAYCGSCCVGYMCRKWWRTWCRSHCSKWTNSVCALCSSNCCNTNTKLIPGVKWTFNHSDKSNFRTICVTFLTAFLTLHIQILMCSLTITNGGDDASKLWVILVCRTVQVKNQCSALVYPGNIWAGVKFISKFGQMWKGGRMIT